MDKVDPSYAEWVGYHRIGIQVQPETKRGEYHIDHICKHLVKIGGMYRCRIYDKRPQICRDFPSKPECECPGFKWVKPKEMS
jgi:Fe-S-cluster containining protein